MNVHARYRRIIDIYRTGLLEADPAACNRADIKVEALGEGWVSDNRLPDLDAVKTAAEIAEQFGLSTWDIQNWHKRHPDQIPVKGKWRGKNLYCVRDVVSYFGRR